MTKQLRIPMMVLIPALMSACGKYEKNPVQNLDQLREYGARERTLGPDKPQVIREEIRVEVPVEVIREVETQVPVVVTQVIEQATVDERYLIIAPDADMSFTEGKASSFKIRARVLLPGARINLVGQNMPEGATLRDVSTETEQGLYELSWTPALGLVPANVGRQVLPMKVVAQIVATQNEADRRLLEGLMRERDINLTVFRDQSPPSDLTVVNLPQEVNEGTLTSFQVTVNVPGTDGRSPQKPSLVALFDGVTTAAGQDFQERDGTRHVTADAAKSDVEHVSGQTWRFNRVFDTRNIPPQPQLARDGTVVLTADGVRVRLSFKVYSPNGASTAQVLKQIKIKYDRPLMAPRFDLSGLGQDTLALTPGEIVTLNFYVESSDNRAQVRVQTPSLSGISGSPSVSCRASSAGAFRQACTLRWSVPCSATATDLTQTLVFSAVSEVGGRASESASYTLKVEKSNLTPLCAAAAPQTPEVTP